MATNQNYPDTSVYYPDAKQTDSFQDGMEFQDRIIQLYLDRFRIIIQPYSSRRYQYEKGESVQGYEIKLDDRCTDTGRLSIEIAEKGKASEPDYKPSGIYSPTDPVYYIQGNLRLVFEFYTHHLRQLFETGEYQVEEKSTVKTFYLPFDQAARLGRVVFGDISLYPKRTNGNPPKSFEQLLLL